MTLPPETPHLSHLGLRMPSYYERQRLREVKKLTPVQFAPVLKDPMKPQTKLKMLQSVHGRFQNGVHFELVAGKSYWVDRDKADEFIAKGYAEGNLSRKFSDDEIAALRGGITVVQVPPTENDRFITEL